jgi:tetratricopeptide (TPR) repeat protein
MMTAAEDADAIDPLEVRLARAVARAQLGSLLAAQAQQEAYRGALADCDAVIAEQPRLAMAHYHRGVALRLLGENRRAIDAFAETLRLAPDNAEARLRRGIAWFHLGEFDLALSDFRRLGRMPGDPRPSFWIGVVHAQRGEHDEAIRGYTEALNENGRYRLALVNRALAYMQLGSWQRAIDDLNELIQLNPADAQAYHRRGLAQQRLGRLDEARRSFAKARQ